MKIQSRLADEVPVTKEALKIYVKEMEKAFKPVSLQYNRMKELLQIANERLEHMYKFNKETMTYDTK